MKNAMTLSNLLSVTRIILAPVIVLLVVAGNLSILIAFIVFFAAGLTDYFDGYLARKLNTKSALGAFIDPLADKVLIFSAFFAFYLINQIDLWMVIAIVARDVIVTVLRIIMLQSGCQLITSQAAKWKTAVQFFAVTVLFTLNICAPLHLNTPIIPITMYAVVGFTIWTGITYFIPVGKSKS